MNLKGMKMLLASDCECLIVSFCEQLGYKEKMEQSVVWPVDWDVRINYLFDLRNETSSLKKKAVS